MSGAAWCAALVTVLACSLCWPSPRHLLRYRLGPSETSQSDGFVRRSHVMRGSLMLMPGVMLLPFKPAFIVLIPGGIGLAWFIASQLTAARRRRRLLHGRATALTCVELLAAELRAGVLPQRALAELSGDFAFLKPVSEAASRAGDVAAPLRAAAQDDGYSVLNGLAAAWLVAERTGAPLADLLDRLALTLRDDADVEREVQAGVGPARSTGRMMAALPLLGLALGVGLEGDPLRLMTQTLPGVLCLALGLGLACLGVAWIDRIALKVERP